MICQTFRFTKIDSHENGFDVPDKRPFVHVYGTYDNLIGIFSKNEEKYYKSWNNQERIDMASYNYDKDESFSNIDISSFKDGSHSNDETFSNVIKNNCKEVCSSISVNNNKEKEDEEDKELDKILDGMDTETHKISNTLLDIQTCLSNRMKARTAIEKSISELYKNMKNANEPQFFENQPSKFVRNLEHDRNENLDSQVTLISIAEKFRTPIKIQNETSSNTTCQMTSTIRREKIGRYFRDYKRTFDIRSILLKGKEKRTFASFCISNIPSNLLKFIWTISA